MLHRARPVHDAEPQDGQVKALPAGIQPQAQLGVDLGEVRKVALGAVGMVGADFALQSVAVHVRRPEPVVPSSDAASDLTCANRTMSNAGVVRRIEAHEKACPLLVPLVEEGWVDHPVTEEIARIYLNEAFSDSFQSADVLLLGCTHYPLLRPVLQRVAPAGVTLVDSAESTALAVRELLSSKSATETAAKKDHVKFFVTDSTEKFRRLGRLFLGQDITDITHVDLKE